MTLQLSNLIRLRIPGNPELLQGGQFWIPQPVRLRASRGGSPPARVARPAAKELEIMAGKLLPAKARGPKIRPAGAKSPVGAASQTILAFSSSFETRQALVFDSLRVATISTRSPSLHSLFSSCA